MLFNSQVVVLCVISIALVTADNTGEVCQLDSKNTTGQCVLLKDCPQAIKDLKLSLWPQTCSFKGIEPVVCCEKTEKPVSGAISKQKCIEYGESVYEMKQPPTLSGSSEPVKVDTCVSVHLSTIIRGTTAFPREFPHMAVIGYGEENKKEWMCSGTLISDQFVLTAAHCMVSRDLGEVRWVRLGEYDIGVDIVDTEPEDFSVLEVIIHPDYKRPSVYNDIALIKLNKRVKFNRFIRPACLHTGTDKDTPRYIATGWGNTITGDRFEQLQRIILDKVSPEQCNATYQNYGTWRRLKHGIVPETQMCAGQSEKDECVHGSGGPLQIYNQDVYCMYSLVGVTSFGQLCGSSTIPGIYTRVSAYIDWIEKIVWP